MFVDERELELPVISNTVMGHLGPSILFCAKLLRFLGTDYRQLCNTCSDRTYLKKKNFIFMAQDLYQFNQQLELYTMYLSIFENT
jgi:hypothetical protein